MQYDVIIIGAGLSGLSAAALLAKRGLKVALFEQSGEPGGACGVFKRGNTIFDKGVAMLYGFGEKGFNSHRFLFNCLEEPIEVIRHDLLYTIYYNGYKIPFSHDIHHFITELSQIFPRQKKNIRHFYKDMAHCYKHVISDSPSYTTPDETNPEKALLNLLKHPVSYMRFLSYMNISTRKLLERYFDDPEILNFFNKLTTTYCYTTIDEAPAILASVMFIDNHVGGSYYPAGSTLYLPGKLEKVIEEHGGNIFYLSKVQQLLFKDNHLCGIRLANETCVYGTDILYSGTIWNLYDSILPPEQTTLQEKNWAISQVPTYPSVVLYALVDQNVIPPDSCPVEMLASTQPGGDVDELTLYISSLDDHTLCDANYHTVIAIGPNLQNWKGLSKAEYLHQKLQEQERILHLLENHFPGFHKGLHHCELATPSTIEGFTGKNNGAAAGPKQMLGQHMLLRQHIRTRWENLFICGESTVMGTGTPTVTTSGIAAANAILSKHDLPPYLWKKDMKNYVRVLTPPIDKDWISHNYSSEVAHLITSASKCHYCTNPTCCSKDRLDVPGIMRRVTCGNLYGAMRQIQLAFPEVDSCISSCSK